ncbi:unnamed protein product [Amoebophrya sp. A120]|nr:unnamed protein product [Amoebophrya sp. A120]|eukprot:GSA120T00017648001.1
MNTTNYNTVDDSSATVIRSTSSSSTTPRVVQDQQDSNHELHTSAEDQQDRMFEVVGNQQPGGSFGSNSYDRFGEDLMAEKVVRRGFIRKVYGLLTMQLLCTTLIAAPFATHMISNEWVVNNAWLGLISMVGSLAIVCAGSCNPELFRRYPSNYLCLMVFTILESVLVGFVVSAYNTQSVILVFLLTCTIFGLLSCYAMCTDTDFTGMGTYLFAFLAGLCVMSLVLMFFPGPEVDKFQAGIGAVLFSFYIIYDTQLIMGGKHKVQFSIDDYVFAALNIYMDILNLFLDLLRILGENSNN